MMFRNALLAPANNHSGTSISGYIQVDRYSLADMVWYGTAVNGARVSSAGHIVWGIRVPNLVVLFILGYAPGYPQGIYSGVPGYQTGCFGYTLVCTRIPPRVDTQYLKHPPFFRSIKYECA